MASLSNSSRRVAAAMLKELLVEAMGGKCQCCGYVNKACLTSMDFHHIDPTEKEYSVFGNKKGVDLRRMSRDCWHKIVKEAKKTVLLCKNCHNELHAGGVVLPKKIAKFDESFARFRIQWCQEYKLRCLAERQRVKDAA